MVRDKVNFKTDRVWKGLYSIVEVNKYYVIMR